MFNVTILKIKDLVNYIIIVTIAVVAIVFLFKINNKKNLTISLSKTVPTVFQVEKNETIKPKDINNETDYMKQIINSQISSIEEAQKSTETAKEENIQTNNTQEEIVQEETTEEVPNNAATEVVTQNPIQENFNAEYGKVKIKNGTNYTLTQEMMTPNITIENKNILIFHTHILQQEVIEQLI